MEEADALYQQGDYEGALDSYNTALDFNPQNGEAHHGKADALYQQGAYQEALDSYINFIKLSPSSSSNTILVDKGKDLLNQQKEVEKSVKYLNTALDFNPQNGEAYYVRGNALYQQGDYEGALDSYKKSIGDSGSYSYYFDLEEVVDS